MFSGALVMPSLRVFTYYAILIAGIFGGCQNPQRTIKQKGVYIDQKGDQYTLYRNGKPYYIKGAAGSSNLRELAQAGGNTIRTFDTLNLAAVLDEAQRNNLAVVVGLPLPESQFMDYIYNDPRKVTRQFNEYKKLVNRFKNHPAILFWCVGNEVVFEVNIKRYNFYKAYNSLVEMIHQDDPDHPVTTTIISLREVLGIKLFTDVDIISINIFSSLSELRAKLEKISFFWDDPFLITEWGVAGPWLKDKTAWEAHIESTSTKKAEQYLEMYTKFLPRENPRLLGAFVFYWGSKQETTHTWFSIFNKEGQGTEVAGVMQYIWSGKWPQRMAPKLNYMLLNGKGARENILFKPGEKANATLLMADSTAHHIIWEIYPEDWYRKNNEKNTKIIKPLKSVVIKSDSLLANFKAPAQEGPYRIFATVYDRYGNFATCNTPFYVVSN